MSTRTDSAPSEGRLIRVVVVDDDFMVADIHRRLVEREEGFSVVAVARTAREAIEAVESHHPDLVLLDIYLPDASGLDVLARLRATRTTADFLVITAAKDVDTVREAIRQGTVHYLVKPFDVGDFVERLRAYRSYRELAPRRSGALDDSVDQRQVDRTIALLRPPLRDERTLPKGLSPMTMERVIACLRANDGAPKHPDGHDTGQGRTASEVASETGIARVSARRYLDHLATTGAVETSPRYGGSGRPEIEYRVRRS
jgi:response regulator of citrate/malate metabolism